MSTIVSAADKQIPILIVDGQSTIYHYWQMVTPILKQELEDTGLFQVTVATAPLNDGDSIYMVGKTVLPFTVRFKDSTPATALSSSVPGKLVCYILILDH